MRAESVRAFLSSYFGLPSISRQLIINSLEGEDARALADPLTEPIATFGESAKVPRYGLSATRVKKGIVTSADVAQSSSKAGTLFALVLQDQNLELLTPLPRRLAPGGTAQLQARALGAGTKGKAEMVAGRGKFIPIPGQD